MRAVRLVGGGDFAVFDPSMSVDLKDQTELLRDLRLAVSRGELALVYQPKVDARNLQITAAEALVRWHHPQRGLISPTVFIPLAERFGLIGPIGNWVIDEACRQAGVWRRAGLHMRVAINISAYQMRQDDLVDRLQAALTAHGLSASRFTCEITESVAMEDTKVTHRSFERMRRAGLHVSIDDFGVGQASLSYLRRLPAAELKIDASFVRDLEASVESRAIVTAVVQLAHALHLRVVAEGVETRYQRDTLVSMGCDELQGYLFAKPMSATALSLWAAEDDERAPGTPGGGFRESLFRDTEAS
jgi:EAL domain-containing protein (putative c-di-GMP-specific phosphodiesterase class I)